MKNLFLTLVFVLGTATSFATNNALNEIKTFDTIEVTKSCSTEEDEKTCIQVELSCGITGWACGYLPMDIIFIMLAADAELCP